MRLFIIILFVLFATVLAAADPPPPLPAAVDKAYKAYVAALAKSYLAETEKVKVALKREQDAATRKSDLDTAMAIKALLTKIDGGIGLDDAKAEAKSGGDLLGDAGSVGIRGWASVVVTAADSHVQAADARVGTVAILNTQYTFANMDLPVPKGVDCKVMQVPQGYSGPTSVKVVSGGRIYFVSGLPLDALLAQLPRELKAGAASGVSAPGVMSVACGTAAAGASFTLAGHETRVIAGAITITR